MPTAATTLHDIISDRFARKAVEKGADGLIAVAAGAGGHAGSISPFALIQDIRAWFDGPLLLSGAIATGHAVLAAQAMGADLAYIGSAFIATEEARAIDAYKQAIVEGDSSHIVGSTHFTGIFGNYLRPSIAKAGLDPDNLPAGRSEGDELRFQRSLGGEGLAGHLGQRTGHRRDQGRSAGRRSRRAARARVRRGEKTHLRLAPPTQRTVTVKRLRRVEVNNGDKRRKFM